MTNYSQCKNNLNSINFISFNKVLAFISIKTISLNGGAVNYNRIDMAIFILDKVTIV